MTVTPEPPPDPEVIEAIKAQAVERRERNVGTLFAESVWASSGVLAMFLAAAAFAWPVIHKWSPAAVVGLFSVGVWLLAYGGFVLWRYGLDEFRDSGRWLADKAERMELQLKVSAMADDMGTAIDTAEHWQAEAMALQAEVTSLRARYEPNLVAASKSRAVIHAADMIYLRATNGKSYSRDTLVSKERAMRDAEWEEGMLYLKRAGLAERQGGQKNAPWLVKVTVPPAAARNMVAQFFPEFKGG